MNNNDLLRENLELTEQVNQLACEVEELKMRLAEACIYLDDANDKIDSLMGELDGVVSSQNWLRASGYKKRLFLEEKEGAR